MGYKEIINLISKYLPHPQALQLNQWIDELRKENQTLRDEISGLKERITELTAHPSSVSVNSPPCPNCSTAGRVFYTSPIPRDFVELEGATHECTKCGWKNTKM